MASSTLGLVERKCVVCGQGSHRSDWADKANPACDSHSEEEVRAATSSKSRSESKATKQPSPAPADSKAPTP